MVHISSKLNFNNLNLELMQHFARLQMKDQVQCTKLLQK